jgi:hypothetical protein
MLRGDITLESNRTGIPFEVVKKEREFGASATAIACAVILFTFGVISWVYFPYIHQHE